MQKQSYLIREKPHRLSPENYKGRVIVAYTLCIKNRKPAFANEKISVTINDMLVQTLFANDCSSHVHLFMPDHCHFLLQGDHDLSNSREAIIKFKQKSGFWFTKNAS